MTPVLWLACAGTVAAIARFLYVAAELRKRWHQ